MRQENRFHDACKNGELEVVELLLRRGADINQSNKLGMTPLYFACRWGQLAVVDLLLTKGASINPTSDDEVNPLCVACEYGHRNIVEFLLDKGFILNQVRQCEPTPLYMACQEGKLQVVELLLDRGAAINQTVHGGVTPLYIACQEGYRDIAQLLLSRGANLNQANQRGLTPLSVACRSRYLSIAELLISSNKLNGYTPEHLKLIIHSCASNRHIGRANAMSFCIIAYRCYKQLQLIDPSYMPNDRERTVIGHGRVQQERQTYTLLSVFFDHRKKRGEDVLPQDVCRKMTTYLPLVWLRNDDNTTTHQSLVS